MKLIFFAVIICLSTSLVAGREVEVVSDDDLVHLIKTEDSVVVLFTKKDCKDCLPFEGVLEELLHELEENLRASVVMVYGSVMVSIYNPAKEPALVYFRRGIPLLYHGNVKADDILQFFTENQDPAVKELSDANFEHLTQAASGATTGDWLIFFYSNDCVICQRLYAVWEGVAATLKQRMNVARVNRLEAGISTAKRFNINKSPEIILLRQGKFYRYRSSEYTPDKFVQFAESRHREQKGDPVPPVTNPINDYVAEVLQFVGSYYYFLLLGAVGLGLTLTTSLLARWLMSTKKKDVQKTKKAK